MFERLDSKEERAAAVSYFLEASKSDGYMSAPEWAKFGSKIGWVGKPKR